MVWAGFPAAPIITEELWLRAAVAKDHATC